MNFLLIGRGKQNLFRDVHLELRCLVDPHVLVFKMLVKQMGENLICTTIVYRCLCHKQVCVSIFSLRAYGIFPPHCLSYLDTGSAPSLLGYNVLQCLSPFHNITARIVMLQRHQFCVHLSKKAYTYYILHGVYCCRALQHQLIMGNSFG